MNLDKLSTEKKASEGVEMTLKHPTTHAVLREDEDDPKSPPIVLRLRGHDAPEYIDARRKLATRRHEEYVTSGKANANANEIEDDLVELLVAATVGWRGIARADKPVPFSKENARALYKDPGLAWLREQAQAFIASREHFLGN